jgi:Zn-finger nucleic acid-binding protein
MSATYTCPRCAIALTRESIEQAGVMTEQHRCTKCGGRYFAAGKLEAIHDIVKVEIFESWNIPSERTQFAPIPCPACGPGDPMLKFPDPREPDVTVDVCPKCRGTWLDRGELEAIQEEGILTFARNLLSFFIGPGQRGPKP